MPPEQSRPIPFGKLNFDVWKKLAIKLEPLDEFGKPGDWRSLASLLKYNAEYIKVSVTYDCSVLLFLQKFY